MSHADVYPLVSMLTFANGLLADSEVNGNGLAISHGLQHPI